MTKVSSAPQASNAVATLFEKKTLEPLARKPRHTQNRSIRKPVEKAKPTEPTAKPAPAKEIRDPAVDARTLFIGNVPMGIHKNKIKQLVSKFGKVESLRFRGLPIKDKWKGKNSSIRVGVMLKDFNESSETCQCYVVFSDPAAVTAAIKSDLNGSESLGAGHILRLDSCVKREDGGAGQHFDRKRSVYVHLIPSDVKDSEIKESIESGDAALKGKIRAIRVCHIKTNGKAFAYVMFTERSHVKVCLDSAESLKIRGKQIKVERVQKPEEMQKAKEEKAQLNVTAHMQRTKNVEKLQKRFGASKKLAKGFIDNRKSAHEKKAWKDKKDGSAKPRQFAKPGNRKPSSSTRSPMGSKPRFVNKQKFTRKTGISKK